MLEDRILSTLRFFDLQDLPLTIFELHKFLISDQPIGLNQVLEATERLVGQEKVFKHDGYYFLPGKHKLVTKRLANYEFGIVREKLIKRYIRAMKRMPFIRGVAVAGSQALGQEKPTSDIDLFIITQPGRMWTARTFITLYFHFFRVRRHDKLIANRFCLNHYVAGNKILDEGRNLYSAMEYGKLRPIAYKQGINEFLECNLFWMHSFFPNLPLPIRTSKERPAFTQIILEKIFSGGIGDFFEAKMEQLQKQRIHTDQYVRVLEDELSFHPDSREKKLLSDFLNS